MSTETLNGGPPTTSMRREGRPTHWKVIVLFWSIMLLAAGMRFQELQRVGLSFDESFTMRMVSFPWNEMLVRITAETQPPGFYACLKLWSSLFGNSVLAGRIFTSLWGVAGVGCMYLFVREAYRTAPRFPFSNDIALQQEQAALLAAFFLALSPLQLFWTTQIRMYSMPLTLAMLSSYFAMRALNTPSNRVAPWVWYVLSATALAYTHYFGLFVIVAQLLAVGVVRASRASLSWKDRLLPVLASALAISLLWQFWLPYFLYQRQRVTGHFYLPELNWVVWGRAFDELWVGHGVELSAWRGLCFTQIAFLCMLFILLGKQRGDLMLALGALLPALSALIISVISQPVITARYLMFSQIFLLGIIAVLITRLPKLVRGFTTVIAVLGALWLAGHQWQDRSEMANLPGLKNAVVRHADEATAETLLVTSNPMLFTSAIAYHPESLRVRCYGEVETYPFYQGTPVMLEADYISTDEIDYSRHLELWTLDADEGSMGRVPMDDTWNLVEEWDYPEWFAKLTLRKYQRKHRKIREIYR